MRPLAALLVVLLPGCDPCDGPDTTTFVDASGALGDDGLAALEAHFEAWMSWTPSERVCIDRVEVAEVPDGDSELVHGNSWTVRVDPGAADLEYALREGLCAAFDERENLTARAAEASPDSADRIVELGLLRYWCASGPLDLGWRAQVVAACGADELGDFDRFLADEVYPYAPAPRLDGDLAATMSEPVRVAGTDLSSVVAAADGLAALHLRRDVSEVDEVLLVDPATGTLTPVAEVPWEARSASLYGGPGGAVLLERDDDDVVTLSVLGTDTAWTLELDGYLRQGGVEDGWLYLAGDASSSRDVVAVDLSTGDTHTIELPAAEAPLEVLVNGFAPAPGGFVLQLLEAEVQDSGDAVSIGVQARRHVRYDRAAGTFTDLVDELSMSEIGLGGDGLLLGRLWGQAGAVLGAYDLDGDRVLVSDDVCLETEGTPVAVTGGTAWIVAEDGEDTLLRGIVLTPAP